MSKTSDAKGHVELDFDTRRLQPGTAMQFQVTLPSESVSAAHIASLAVLGFELKVEALRSLVLAEEDLPLQIHASHPDGKPLAQTLTVTVLRETQPPQNAILASFPWGPRETPQVEQETVYEATVSTDAENGVARPVIPGKSLLKGGNYLVRVAGVDRFEQPVVAHASAVVSDDDDAVKLRLFSDQETLRVGEPMQLRVHSRIDAPLALLTVEGETIVEYRIVRLDRGFNPVDLAVDHKYFPNVQVSVAAMHRQTLLSVAKPFRVERRLHVEIDPDAMAYAPGAPARIALRVTDQLGNPVRGEFSLSLVDQALLAQFPVQRPAIVDYFEKGAVRHAAFREASSCGFRHQGDARCVLPEYQQELARLEQTETFDADVDGLVTDELRERLGMLNSAVDRAAGIGGMGGGRLGGIASGEDSERFLSTQGQMAYQQLDGRAYDAPDGWEDSSGRRRDKSMLMLGRGVNAPAAMPAPSGDRIGLAND
ncbi:MAG: hypothetical protein KDA61_22745, partial [Planctomycetales bacterium]|nr:hypothetical protein [Planctomycetales bacterium]